MTQHMSFGCSPCCLYQGNIPHSLLRSQLLECIEANSLTLPQYPNSTTRPMCAKRCSLSEPVLVVRCGGITTYAATRNWLPRRRRSTLEIIITYVTTLQITPKPTHQTATGCCLIHMLLSRFKTTTAGGSKASAVLPILTQQLIHTHVVMRFRQSPDCKIVQHKQLILRLPCKCTQCRTHALSRS